MKTIALVCQKGGAGKTTLALHLAVESPGRAAVLDLDPQASASHWADLRGERGPDVITEHPSRVEAAIAELRRRGDVDLVVLDTAPHHDQAALKAARAADLVVIPCRPATFDLAALRESVELCQLARVPHVVVLNGVPPHGWRVLQDAQLAVCEAGGPLCTVVVHHRVALQHCLRSGDVAREHQPGGMAAYEIAQLWHEIDALALPREVV